MERELLQEVIDYYEGQGKYNFDHLKAHDRANASWDAWEDIYGRIKGCLSMPPTQQNAPDGPAEAF